MKKNILSKVVVSAMIIPFGVANAERVVDFTDSTGLGLSNDVVQISNIRVDNVVQNPFDPARPDIVSVFYNVPFVFDPVTMNLVPDLERAVQVGENLCASLELIVSDSLTGDAINNASVSIADVTTMTDESGIARFTGLNKGTAAFTVSAPDFTTITQDTTLECDGVNKLGAALTRVGDGTGKEIRIVLTWGETPEDLDAHLTGPNVNSNGSGVSGAERFHVFYADTIADVANVDVDDVSSFGPETITITPPLESVALRQGIYRYSVHHYTGNGNISSSNANVSLTLPDNTVRSFSPPSSGSSNLGLDDVWTVFEINVTSTGLNVIPVNTIEHGVLDIDVRSKDGATSSGYGAIESEVNWNNLPSKE